MGYNKYLWENNRKKEYETFGQLKISPIDEAQTQIYEVFIHYGAGHKCEIAEKTPDNVVPKALYSYDINYYRIDRINDTSRLTPEDGILVETRRVVNRQLALYGHTRFYLVKQLS